ncbi:MAG: glycosyl hydrolase family 62 [Deltaproteobacteria bacterium]|nr:glycosyl hydrolase family 62 [Deltaproteobacteria bacterium]
MSLNLAVCKILSPRFKISVALGLILLSCLLSCGNVTIIGTEVRSDTATDSTAETDSNTDSDSDTEIGCGVPSSFSWTSSGPLIYPVADPSGIKDPTVVFYDGKWHIYATTMGDPLNMVYLNFTDWSEAAAAPQTLVSTNPNLSGYASTPQLFYFSPQQRWYLVHQSQEPTYSTSTDPSDVNSWSEQQLFMTMPPLLTDAGVDGFDYWVICDDSDCYLFFSGLNDVLYRARTSIENFPNGFEGTTEIVMETSTEFALYDSCNVYRMAGTDQYLLLVSAIGSSGVWRYSRAWTSDRLDGSWTPLADTEDHPFTSTLNTTGADWSNFGIVHGEMLRTNPDETMTINTCDMRFLYSGLLSDTDAGNEYYCLALLTGQ